MRVAEHGIIELQKQVDTLLIIPNQNLFRVANEKTTFADAFAMADQVLYSGVACITDLMVKEGLINLDFADVRAVMREMGKAMMGTGEASGEKRALSAAEAAISNPLIDDTSMKGAKGLLISITGGKDLTLYEVDEAATRIREEVDQRRQHHRRRDLRRKPRRHRPRVGRRDRHRRRAVGAPAGDHAARPSRRSLPHRRRRPAGGRGGFAPRRADADPARQHAAHGGAHRARPTRRIARSRRRWRRSRRPPRRRRRSRSPSAPAEAPVAAIEDVTIRPIAPKPSLFLEPVETGGGSRAGAGRTREAVHSAAGGASGGACAAHAAHRRAADPGAEPDPRAPGRAGRAGRLRRSSACRCCSGSPRSASAAARRRKPQPAPARAGAGRGRARRSADAEGARRCRRCSARPSRGAESVSEYAKRPVAAAAGPARSRPARPAGACEQPDGRRSTRDPGVPAPSGELTRAENRANCGGRPGRAARCRFGGSAALIATLISCESSSRTIAQRCGLVTVQALRHPLPEFQIFPLYFQSLGECNSRRKTVNWPHSGLC